MILGGLEMRQLDTTNRMNVAFVDLLEQLASLPLIMWRCAVHLKHGSADDMFFQSCGCNGPQA